MAASVRTIAIALLFAAGLHGAAAATDEASRLLWGDLHLHSSYSFDAYINGARTVSPEVAYRFARGEAVESNTGLRARLDRPLDFIAIADHAENLGLYERLAAGDPLVAGTPVAERYAELLELFSRYGLREAFIRSMREQGPLPELDPAARDSIWRQVTALADRYNAPGTFTTLIAYEWTSMISGDNLHRVVIYRDGAGRAARRLPLEARADPDPEALWRELADYEQVTGGRVLAIPHNGNLSNGRMFADFRVNGLPLDGAYARNRSRWEPVYEITQVKGDGETHPLLSPEDAFADFETWDHGNVAGNAPKQPWMLGHEYARQALLAGLAHDRKSGANPFRFGLIGSTDIHTGLSTTAEDNFFGKFGGSEPSPTRLQTQMAGGADFDRALSASGLVAVWAAANTREAIFDAIARREVYATTGTRIGLRLRAGWNYTTADLGRADCLLDGCGKGVAMGAVLPARGRGTSPRLLIHATRDPRGANLDRVQVVKGWVDRDGRRHEQVFDAAWSAGRSPAADGKLPAVGNTVDAHDATWNNDSGAGELTTVWTDPAFDPTVPAFWYLRVLEIPTPRWTTIDAARYGTPLPTDEPATLQERAYSSPVWYQPPAME